jgi:excisionase family DNA binding protein
MIMTDEKPTLRSGAVAERFGVDTKTVLAWVHAGKLKAVKTLGGHYRFRESDVNAAAEAQQALDGQ